MPNALPGSGEGKESFGVKEPFIGRIEYSRPDCDCEVCEKGREAKAESGQDFEDPEYDHLYHINPLKTLSEDVTYEKALDELGINTSTSWNSKWMVFAGHLENIHGPFADLGLEGLDDLGDFLTGRVYEFRDISFQEDEEFTWEHAADGEGHTENLSEMFSEGFEPRPLTVPVREVTDPDELQELGVEPSAADAEPVDL